MAKKNFRCKECGYENPKWLGKCPECGAWGSFEENFLQTESGNSQGGQPNPPSQNFNTANKKLSTSPESISAVLEKIKDEPTKRNYIFSADLLNEFFGKGLIAGSLTLLAGEPGLGKSTLSLQLLRALWNDKNNQDKQKIKLLYITAEESVFELARRSERLKIPKEIMVLQTNNFEHIDKVLEEFRPDVVIVDSIQTIFSSYIQSNPGSVTQVSSITSQFLAISKSKNISIILIGHVTKEGQIAGPKTLEHLVDAVLLLESTESTKYRTLNFSKNRFGNTTGLLLLKMEPDGLQIVTDPSLALLENIESGIGVTYAMAMDKDLPLAIEIQALVSQNYSENNNFFGKREAIGISTSKLNTILAIMEKFLNLKLKSNDIYVQITGSPKNLKDESIDLAIMLAILSSLYNKDIFNLLKVDDTKKKNQKLIFSGRLTLSGKLRNATNLEIRQETAKKLGFLHNPSIKAGELKDLILK